MKRNCTTSMNVSQALIICRIPNSTVVSGESSKNHITNMLTIEHNAYAFPKF